MKAFVEYVVKGLVDDPDSVQIRTSSRNGLTIFEVQVGPGDAGKVIGRRGATIQAIRSLLQVGAMKAGLRCQLDLVED